MGNVVGLSRSVSRWTFSCGIEGVYSAMRRRPSQNEDWYRPAHGKHRHVAIDGAYHLSVLQVEAITNCGSHAETAYRCDPDCLWGPFERSQASEHTPSPTVELPPEILTLTPLLDIFRASF